ncbi:MAG: ATP-binding protein, partial [Myxococcota bacterium]
PRLLVLFLAVTAVSATVSFVGFAFWGQTVVEEARVFEMRAAAAAIRPRIDRSRPELQEILERTVASADLRIALVGADGGVIKSDALPLPSPLPPPGEPALFRGKLVLVLDVTADKTQWQRMILVRPAGEIFDRVFSSAFAVLGFLAIGSALGVAAGVLLARRSLVNPLERLFRLVAESDHAGLKTFGGHSDTFASLGRNILAMNERIGSDTQKIAAQLEALKEANTELETAQSQLVRAERLAVVGTLAAGFAHEVGNPLAVVSGFVELLRDDALDDAERIQAVRRIETELQRIQGIVRDLLDFSRAPTDVVGTCSVSDVLAEVRALLAPQKPFARLTLEIEAQDLTLAIDKNALVQVLLNLALNAADAMDGVGTLRIEVQGGALAEIFVEDSGPGIAKEHLATVFEPFFTTKEAGKGTGLGLSVCERIVTSAGGAIRVDRSERLGGARFAVALPQAG